MSNSAQLSSENIICLPPCSMQVYFKVLYHKQSIAFDVHVINSIIWVFPGLCICVCNNSISNNN